MSPRSLVRLFAAYVALVLVASVVVAATVAVGRTPGKPWRTIVSVWSQGKRRARTVVKPVSAQEIAGEGLLARELDISRGVRTAEDILDSSAVLSVEPIVFGASFVAGRDGVMATVGNRIAYLTVDDLLALQAYDHPLELGPIRLQLGVDPDVVFGALAKELGLSEDDLLERATFRRLALRRVVPPEPTLEVTPETLRDSAIAAGRYLAHAVRGDGSYRYEVNAVDNKESEGYNWPRHCGATWYLAESAIYAREPFMLAAAERAARRLAGFALAQCGEHRCVAEGDRADLGSSALGLLALVEMVEGGLTPELLPVVRDLAAFLRSQQRPDGEFMHFYDRVKSEPVDQQVLYYTGEASFALARAARVTKDPRDLAAASRALDHLVTYPPWYLARHYFFGAEHWTCHALEDLWERAPNPRALEFCLEWQEAVYTLAIWNREASPEYDGATSAGPFVPPALVGTATRMEAGVATLRAAKLAGISASRVSELESKIRTSLKFLMLFQHNPGPTEIMANPAAARGGFPNTTTDYHVRIDYPQHAGTAIIAYLKQLERARAGAQGEASSTSTK